MEKKANSEIQDAIERFSDGEYTPEAVAQVHKWLLIKKNSEQKKEAWKSVWSQTKPAEEDVTASLAGTYRRIAADAGHLQEVGSRRRRILYRIATCAAAVVVVVLTSITTFHLSEKQIRLAAVLTSVSAVDSAQTFSLPDGSTVRLKRGTTLFYPNHFSRDSRDVQLVGEAWFEVKTQHGKPFCVHARGTQIVVRGTTFNFKAYPDCNQVEAVLATGAIDFVVSGQIVQLKPSQKLTYDTRNSGVELTTVDLAEELKPNIHVFRGCSLGEALETIGRIFGHSLRLDDPALGRIEISGSITIDGDNSLQHTLEILTLTTDTKYKYAGDQIIIYQ